jgi:hypothetical protein
VARRGEEEAGEQLGEVQVTLGRSDTRGEVHLGGNVARQGLGDAGKKSRDPDM